MTAPKSSPLAQSDLSIPRKIYYEKEISFINSRSYGPGRYDSNYEENGVDYPIGYIRWTEGRNFQAVVDLMSTVEIESRKSHHASLPDRRRRAGV